MRDTRVLHNFNIKTWWIFGCVFFLFFFVSPLSEAREYQFPSLKIEAQVEKEGHLFVREIRQVRFDGKYTGFYQWIQKLPDEQITDIRIYDNGKPLSRNPREEIGPAGTFFIRDEGSRIYVDWSFEAANEVREFVLEYRILNGVRIHNDVAEVHYQLVGNEWEKGIARMHATLRLPPGAQKEEIRAWGHGPLYGQVRILDGKIVEWEIENLPSNTMVAGRVTFPVRLVPEGKKITGREGLPGILSEEEAWAKQANRERLFKRFDIFGGATVLLLGLGFAFLQWFRYGKEPKTDFQGEYYRELPSQKTPAEVGYLWRFKRTTGADLTATIMDLARRGYFQIEAYDREERKFIRTTSKVDFRLTASQKEESSLYIHERSLLQFLFRQVGTKGQVTFQELEEYSKRERSAFAVFWEEWAGAVKLRMEEAGVFHNFTTGEVVKRVIPLILLIVFSMVLIIFTQGGLVFTGMAGFFVGIVNLGSMTSHRKRTEKGAEENKKWKAFRKFLKDFSNIRNEGVPALVIWEHYLVFAITLGVAKEVLKSLELVYPGLQDGNYRFGQNWYVIHSESSSFSSFQQSINGLTQSMTTSVDTALQTALGPSSSGSGGGGGFSGGGGGGGSSGGGGGGAR